MDINQSCEDVGSRLICYRVCLPVQICYRGFLPVQWLIESPPLSEEGQHFNTQAIPLSERG
jgi:hypothetical protein